MSFEAVFLKINRGARLNAHLGLQMDEGVPYRFARDYTYVEIPLRQVISLSSDEKIEGKAVRNQRVRIEPACTINVNDHYKALIKPHPSLHEYGICPTMKLIDQHDGEQASYNMTMQKDFDFSELPWCVRIYLFG